MRKFTAAIASATLLLNINSAFSEKMGGYWQYIKNDDGGVLGWKGSASSQEFVGIVLTCANLKQVIIVSVDLPPAVKTGSQVSIALSNKKNGIKISGVVEDGLGGANISQELSSKEVSRFLEGASDLTVKIAGAEDEIYSDERSGFAFKRFLKSCRPKGT